MKQCVMPDNFRVLIELEKLAEKAIEVLNQSRDTRSCSEANLLRKSLRKILADKENKLEKTLMTELVALLGEIAKYSKDPTRSFKSEGFKNLGDEINDFLQKTVSNELKNQERLS